MNIESTDIIVALLGYTEYSKSYSMYTGQGAWYAKNIKDDTYIFFDNAKQNAFISMCHCLHDSEYPYRTSFDPHIYKSSLPVFSYLFAVKNKMASFLEEQKKDGWNLTYAELSPRIVRTVKVVRIEGGE